jgi:hypothetical protein
MTNLSIGFTDANGVWTYGELDPTGPYFSDFLALGMSSISANFNQVVNQKTSTQAIPITTTTAVTAYDAADHTTLPGTWSPSAGTFTATVAGKYKVFAQAEFAAGTATYRIVRLQKALAASPRTFTTTRSAGIATAALTTELPTVNVQDYITLAVGDVIRVPVQVGVAINLTNCQIEIAIA